MTKHFVTISFLICLGLAAWTYWSRDNKSLRDSLASHQRDPRVIIEDFSVYRYKGAVVKSHLTAKLGYFHDPNLVQIDGELKGERTSNHGQLETMSAESGTALFNSKTLGALMTKESHLERADLSGFVEVGVNQHTLTTDHAEFLDKDQMILSTRPVRVDGPGRVFSGEEGFIYRLKDETLIMPGQVNGVVKLEER